MMKRLIPVIVAALLIPGAAFSQKTKITFGVKGGANVSTLTNPEGLYDWPYPYTYKDPLTGKMETRIEHETTTSEDIIPKVSFYVGAFLEFEFNKWLSLQPELLYIRQGAYFEYPIKVDKQFASTRYLALGYVQLPVVVKFQPFKNFFIEIGPQVGYMLDARDRLLNKAQVGHRDIYYDSDGIDFRREYGKYIDNYERFDFSAVGGLTYRLSKMVEISARYTYGFTQINKPEGEDGDNGAYRTSYKPIKNQVIMFGLNLRLE